jgi:hypothetical protein
MAIVAVAIARRFIEAFGEHRFDYDLSSGKQTIVARKNRMLAGPRSLTFEGK